MDTIDNVVIEGYTYWRITPIKEVPQTYTKLVFNPSLWGMAIALLSIALWLSVDLIFQVHVTFRRWGGMYYWTVLGTSIGVGLHATSVAIKAFTVLTIAQDIGTTVLAKTGDILTQTGFSLVLYSRLKLIKCARTRLYLKWILITILASSFLVHTPAIIFTFALNTRIPGWYGHTQVAEKFVILWFTIQEFALSTIYTYSTARLIKDLPGMSSCNALQHQAKKTRRNLLLFMVFAQIITFTFDMTLVMMIMLEPVYKAVFMPAFYGIKLKVEFMALNQLQRLVQPQARTLEFMVELDPENQGQQVESRDGETLGLAIAKGTASDIEKGLLCPQCGSLSNDATCPASKDFGLVLKPDDNNTLNDSNIPQISTTPISHASSTKSISDLERRYLGRHST
jgi:hypothetical protein